MRVSLAVQDAVFVAGVVQHGRANSSGSTPDDQRRVAAAVVRRRLLGEPDPTLDEVDERWRAWWPPPPGDEGRDAVRGIPRRVAAIGWQARRA